MWLPQLLLAVALLCLKTFKTAHGVILTPPYFNLAEGRRIYATATCGEEIQEPELYCKLVGANADRDVNVNLIQGQVSFEKTPDIILCQLRICSLYAESKVFWRWCTTLGATEFLGLVHRLAF
jgi:laminin alpha 3/5